MNTKLNSLFLFLLFSGSIFAQSSIEIGQKFTLNSTILKTKRAYNVYLPPSYFSANDKATYPVIYVIDGDYNFHYLTGLIEQMSNIGSKIPEMIVVGVSDIGQEDYIANTTPYDKKDNPTGQSEKFLTFINTELKPIINTKYKTAGYDILIGHSLGGLFTVNALLTKPESFNAYIAISPSLWWGDFQAEKDVEDFFKKHENLNRFLYLSLADEEGMGVSGFYEQLDRNTFGDDYYKNTPLGLDFTFKHYPEENHGSVGFVTVNSGLKLLFKNYDVQYKTMSKLATFEDYETIIQPYATMLGSGFRICDAQMKSLIGMFYDKNMGELLKMETTIKERFPVSLGDYYNHLGNLYLKKGEKEKAIEILEKNVVDYPNAPEFLTSLGDAYFKIKDKEKAKATYEKALALGKKNHSRNWYLNQLEANVLKMN
jgi:hypothetical protein